MKILIVEDNKDLLANVNDYFSPLGYEVHSAINGYSGLALASEQTFDAIILDVMLPGISGFSLCEKLRTELKIQTPVIMLTAKTDVADVINGLQKGADDYLIKPFSFAELAARLEALVRRSKGGPINSTLSVAGLEIDTDRHTVRREGASLDLTPILFKILLMLFQAHPKVVSKETIERTLWGNRVSSDGALRVHIHALRLVIDKPFSQKLIVTVPGIGYRLSDENI